MKLAEVVPAGAASDAWVQAIEHLAWRTFKWDPRQLTQPRCVVSKP